MPSGGQQKQTKQSSSFAREYIFAVSQKTKGYPLTLHEFQVLLEGAGTSTERSARDVAFGAFVTFLVFFVTVVTTQSFSLEGGKANWRTLAACMISALGSLVSGLVAFVYTLKLRSESGRQSYIDLVERVRRDLKE